MEVTAVTSVFVEGVTYAPGEKVKVEPEVAKRLLELGAIEPVELPAAKPATGKTAKPAE